MTTGYAVVPGRRLPDECDGCERSWTEHDVIVCPGSIACGGYLPHDCATPGCMEPEWGVHGPDCRGWLIVCPQPALGPVPLGTVADAGGGEVRVLVDRDLDTYPAVGTEVFIRYAPPLPTRSLSKDPDGSGTRAGNRAGPLTLARSGPAD